MESMSVTINDLWLLSMSHAILVVALAVGRDVVVGFTVVLNLATSALTDS